MASVHFYLKGAFNSDTVNDWQKKDEARFKDYMNTKLQIYCTLATAGKRLKVYTGKRIEPKNWNFKGEKPKSKTYKVDGTSLLSLLKELERDASNLGNQRENSGSIVTLNELRELVKIRMSRLKAKEGSTKFDKLFEQFLEEHRTKHGLPLRPSTKKKYNCLKTCLDDFAKKKNKSLNADCIDKNLLFSFRDYLQKTRKNQDSTNEKDMKSFKTFIGFHQNKGAIKKFDLSEVKLSSKEGEIYVVPFNRLIQLQDFDFKDSFLSSIRDMFCFMCWTGQRYGNYISMKKSDLIRNEKGILEWKCVPEKIVFKPLLSIPIVKYAEQILNRYRGNSLPIPIGMSLDDFNKAVREMGKEMKWDFEVKKVKHYNGIAETENVPFYSILSAHVARKTYITSSLMLGIPERIVREISSSKDEKAFSRYVKYVEGFLSSTVYQAYSESNVERVLNLLESFQPQES